EPLVADLDADLAVRFEIVDPGGILLRASCRAGHDVVVTVPGPREDGAPGLSGPRTPARHDQQRMPRQRHLGHLAVVGSHLGDELVFPVLDISHVWGSWASRFC